MCLKKIPLVAMWRVDNRGETEGQRTGGRLGCRSGCKEEMPGPEKGQWG